MARRVSSGTHPGNKHQPYLNWNHGRGCPERLHFSEIKKRKKENSAAKEAALLKVEESLDFVRKGKFALSALEGTRTVVPISKLRQLLQSDDLCNKHSVNIEAQLRALGNTKEYRRRWSLSTTREESSPAILRQVPGVGRAVTSSAAVSAPSATGPELMLPSEDTSASSSINSSAAVSAPGTNGDNDDVPAQGALRLERTGAVETRGEKKTKNNLSSRGRTQRRSRFKHSRGRGTKRDFESFDDSVFNFTGNAGSSLPPSVKRVRKHTDAGGGEINEDVLETFDSPFSESGDFDQDEDVCYSDGQEDRLKRGKRAIIWFVQTIGERDHLVPYIGTIDGTPTKGRTDKVEIKYADGSSKSYTVPEALQFIGNYDAYLKGDGTAGVDAISNAEGCVVVKVGNNSDDRFDLDNSDPGNYDSYSLDGDDSSYLDSENEVSSNDLDDDFGEMYSTDESRKKRGFTKNNGRSIADAPSSNGIPTSGAKKKKKKSKKKKGSIRSPRQKIEKGKKKDEMAKLNEMAARGILRPCNDAGISKFPRVKTGTACQAGMQAMNQHFNSGKVPSTEIPGVFAEMNLREGATDFIGPNSVAYKGSHQSYFVPRSTYVSDDRSKRGIQVTGWPLLNESLHVTGTAQQADSWSQTYHGINAVQLSANDDYPFDPTNRRKPFVYNHNTKLAIPLPSVGDKVCRKELLSLLGPEIKTFLRPGNLKKYLDSLKKDSLRNNHCAQYGYTFNDSAVHKPHLLGSDRWPKALPAEIPDDLLQSIGNIGALVTGGIEMANAAEYYARSEEMKVYYGRFSDQLKVKKEYRGLFCCTGITTTIYVSRNGIFNGFSSHPDVNNGSGPLVTLSIPIEPSELSSIDQEYLHSKLEHDMTQKLWIVLIYYPRHEMEQTVATRRRVLENDTVSGPVKAIINDLENGIGCYETLVMDRERMLNYMSGRICTANISSLFSGVAMAAVPASFNPCMTISATSHFVLCLSIKYALSGKVRASLLYFNALQTSTDVLIFCMPQMMTGEIEGYRLERGKVDPYTIIEAICVYLSKHYGKNPKKQRYLRSPRTQNTQRWQPCGPNLPYLAAKIGDTSGWLDGNTDYRARFVKVLNACHTLHKESFYATRTKCQDAGETFYDRMVGPKESKKKSAGDVATGLGPVSTHKLLQYLAVTLVVPADCCNVRRIGGDGCLRYVQWQFFDSTQEKAGKLTEQDEAELHHLNVDKSFFQLHHALIAAGVWRRNTMPTFTEHLCCERGRRHDFWYYLHSDKGGWRGNMSSVKAVYDLLYHFQDSGKINNMFNFIERKPQSGHGEPRCWVPCILIVDKDGKPRWETMTNIVAGCAYFEVGFDDPLKMKWEIENTPIPKWMPDGWSVDDGLPLFGFKFEVPNDEIISNK